MGSLAPGYRFCPTDEELLICYLIPKALGKPFPGGTIAEVEIYKYEPWDLPDMSALSTKDSEWYFFSSQDKKYSHTARINRTTSKGFWKATGKDRKVYSGRRIVGLKKTLIYYEGRAPNGCRTNWIMHEYRLDQESEMKEKGMSVSVLCRIRKKGGLGPRNGEQYGASVWNKNGEVDDENDDYESKSGIKAPFYDPGDVDEDNVEEGGNAFNLQNQLKHLISQQSSLEHVESIKTDTNLNLFRTNNEVPNLCLSNHGTDRVSAATGIMMSKRDIISDLPLNLETSYPDVGFDAWGDDEWGDPIIWYHCQGLGELSGSLNDGHCSINSKEVSSGTGAVQSASSDFLGYSIPGHAYSESGFPLREIVQDPYTLRRPSAEGTAISAPAPIWSEGLQLQFELDSLGASEDIIIPLTSHSKSQGTGSQHGPVGSNSKSYEKPYTVECSLQSDLSKQISTYSVSKVEVALPEMSYASLTHNYNCHTEPKKIVSAELSGEGEQLEKLEQLPSDLHRSSATDAHHASEELCKIKDAPIAWLIGNERFSVCSVDVLVPGPQSTEDSTVQENENGVVLQASIPCQGTCRKGWSPRKHKVLLRADVAIDSAIVYSSRKQRVRCWVKNKLKQSAVGVKFSHLEEGMRSKLNEKFSSYAKPAGGFYQTDNETDALHRFKCGILLILYRLVSALLILSCRIWGYHVATLYAAPSYVSVQ